MNRSINTPSPRFPSDVESSHKSSMEEPDFETNNTNGLQLLQDISRYLKKALSRGNAIQNMSSQLNETINQDNLSQNNHDNRAKDIEESIDGEDKTDEEQEMQLNGDSEESNASQDFEIIEQEVEKADITEEEEVEAPQTSIGPKIGMSYLTNLGVASCKEVGLTPPPGVKCFCLVCRITKSHEIQNGLSEGTSMEQDKSVAPSKDPQTGVTYCNKPPPVYLPIPLTVTRYFKTLILNLPKSASVQLIKPWLRNLGLREVEDVMVNMKGPYCTAIVAFGQKKERDKLLQMDGILFEGQNVQIKVYIDPLLPEEGFIGPKAKSSKSFSAKIVNNKNNQKRGLNQSNKQNKKIKPIEMKKRQSFF